MGFCVLRVRAQVLASLGMLGSVGCALVSGLSRLEEVQCVDACDSGGTQRDGDDENTADGHDETVSGDSAGVTDAGGEADSAGEAEAGGEADSARDVGVSDGPQELPDASPDAHVGDAGPRDAAVDGSDASDGSSCRNDLSNIGTADYHIALTLTTTQTGLVALANQRARCGSPMYWWDLRIKDGTILVETEIVNFTSTALVNDGHPHKLLLQHTNGRIWLYIDGVGSNSAATSSSIGALPPLVVGTDPCTSTTAPFAGTIADLCISSP